MYMDPRKAKLIEFQEADFSIVTSSQQYIRTIVTGIPSDLSITGTDGDLEFLDYLLYETILRTAEDVKHASIVWGEVFRQIAKLRWVFLEEGIDRVPCLSDGDINITVVDPHAEVLSELLRAYSSFGSLTMTTLLSFSYRSANNLPRQAALKYLAPFDKKFLNELSNEMK